MVPSPYKSPSQITSATPIFQLRLNDTMNVDSTMDNKRPSTGNFNFYVLIIQENVCGFKIL